VATATHDWDELVGRLDAPAYWKSDPKLRDDPSFRQLDVAIVRQQALTRAYALEIDLRAEIGRRRKRLGVRSGVDGGFDGGKGGAPRNWGLTPSYQERAEQELLRLFAGGRTDRECCEEIGWEWTDANRMRIARFRKSSGHERNPNGST
jgi:hypothetical protein